MLFVAPAFGMDMQYATRSACRLNYIVQAESRPYVLHFAALLLLPFSLPLGLRKAICRSFSVLRIASRLDMDLQLAAPLQPICFADTAYLIN